MNILATPHSILLTVEPEWRCYRLKSGYSNTVAPPVFWSHWMKMPRCEHWGHWGVCFFSVEMMRLLWHRIFAEVIWLTHRKWNVLPRIIFHNDNMVVLRFHLLKTWREAILTYPLYQISRSTSRVWWLVDISPALLPLWLLVRWLKVTVMSAVFYPKLNILQLSEPRKNIWKNANNNEN